MSSIRSNFFEKILKLESTITRRLREYIENQGHSTYDVEMAVGLTRSRLQKILDEDRPVKSDMLEKIVEFLNLDFKEKYHLYTGEYPPPFALTEGMPEMAFAGEAGHYSTAEEVHEEDWGFVKRTVQENRMIKIFRVIGDSMAPTLWDTDIIFCIPKDKHKDGIRDTHIYVIKSALHQSLLIKRIVDRKDGKIRVYSDNRTEAKAFVLNLEREVLSLWRVRAKLTWQLGAPSYSPNYIDQLEKRLSNLETILK